jgi:hypothetical protein
MRNASVGGWNVQSGRYNKPEGCSTSVACRGRPYKQTNPVTGSVWPRGWVQVQLYSSMTTALEGGEWSASRPGRALPPHRERRGTHCTGGWVGPRDRCGKSRPPRETQLVFLPIKISDITQQCTVSTPPWNLITAVD